MRNLLVALVLPLLALPAAAQSELFPSDTFAYVEVDGRALAEGLPELQLVKLLGDPQLRAFLKPTLERLELDVERPAESLLARFPVEEYLRGRAAIGVRGLVLTVSVAGKRERFEVSAGSPVDARMAYRMLGILTRVGQAPDDPVEIAFDGLAVLEPGPRLAEAARGFLAELEQERVKVGGREVSRYVVEVPLDPDVFLRQELWADLSGERWILATSPALLEGALGAPRTPLDLRPVRPRFTGGRPVLFGWIDLAQGLSAFRNLVPPIVAEMNRINGLASLRGVAFGVSVSGGGVRESVGIVLDGDPKGVWRVLDALPGGMRSLEVAPPGALAAVGMKLDPSLLLARLREVIAEVAPGNEGLLEAELAREFTRMGFDLRQEVLPALGDEAALLVYPVARGQIVPDLVLATDTRDEAALRRLLAKLRERTPPDIVRFEEIEVAPGVKGLQVFAPLPMQPVLAVHAGHLYVASRPELLAGVLAWGGEGAPCLLRDDEVFAGTLRALNGGDHANVVALGWLSVRAALPQVFPLLWSQLPSGWFDTSAFPDVKRLAGHFGGAGFSLRRDGHGVVLDFLSPVGHLVPLAVLAAVQERRAPAWAVPVPAEDSPVVPDLGIFARSSDGTGITVISLEDEGVAARAGIREQDKIVAIAGVAVAHLYDLDRELSGHADQATVEVTVKRGAATITLEVGLR